MIPQSLSEHDAHRYVKAALVDADGWRLVLTNHGKERMIARNVSDRRMRNVLGCGRVTEGPCLGANGWKCSFTGAADGGVTVVVGFAFDDIGGQAVVVTVIDLSS